MMQNHTSGQGLEELVMMSDMDFYEKYLADATLEEQAAFFKEFPGFLEEASPQENKPDDELLRRVLETVDCGEESL